MAFCSLLHKEDANGCRQVYHALGLKGQFTRYGIQFMDGNGIGVLTRSEQPSAPGREIDVSGKRTSYRLDLHRHECGGFRIGMENGHCVIAAI